MMKTFALFLHGTHCISGLIEHKLLLKQN